MNEFELIQRHFTRPTRRVVLGVGDDAAILPPEPDELCVSTDMLVAGRHFFVDVDPEALGHKTLAVNLSDLAAMGAEPRWALLALALPSVDEAWAEAFARGFFGLAQRFGVDVVGGDTTRGPLTLSVTIAGAVAPGTALRRDGARAGDDVWVSGCLGAAALAVATRLGRVDGVPDAVLAEARRHLERPEPRLALGLALRGVASAAVDVSDGLCADLGHIAERSGLGFELWADALPTLPWLDERRAALRELIAAGGDDYELCFTAPPDQRARIAALAGELALPLTRIGTMTADTCCRVLDAAGQELQLTRRGYDHFAQG